MSRPDHCHGAVWNRLAAPYLRHGRRIGAVLTQRDHHRNMTSRVGVPAVLSGTTADLERELFHIAVRGLAEGTGFYQDTDERFIALVAHLALADDGWLVRFIGWLRSYDELASAAVVAATEMARTRLAAGLATSGGNRNVISSVLLRADEPGELLGYWFRRYGRSVPPPIRNGLAAARNLYAAKPP